MENDATQKGMTKRQQTLVSGMGAYASHKKIPFNEWKADVLIAKEHLHKTKKVFMDFKR